MRRTLSIPVSSILLMLTAAAGVAQEASDTTAPVLLPGLTVTVLRMPLELIRAPYAVSIQGKEQIQRARPGLGLDEAFRGVPGVHVDNRFNYALGERISIRGFGARAQFGVRGVRVLVDGIPATFPDGQTDLSHVDLGSLQSVEVIRGPASALYGGSAGGVIQFETEGPPLVPFAHEVGIVGGSNGMLRLNSSAGGHSGRASYQLNLSRLDFGGYREFSSARNTRLSGQFGLAGRLNEFRVSVSAVDYEADNPGALSEQLLRENRNQAFSGNLQQQTGKSGQQAQAGIRWLRRAALGDLEVMGYGINRTVDNPTAATIIDLRRNAGGLRALFRSDPSAAPLGLRFSAGMDADHQRDDRTNFGNQQGQRGNVTLDQFERVTNLAGYAHVTTSPVTPLTLLGGVRYDWYRFAVADRFITQTNPDDTGSRVMRALSPSVGVTYSFGDVLNLYGNVATSFETPTTTELANRPSGAGGFNPELEPQTATSFELGTKGRLPWRISYDLSAYHTDVRNSLIGFEVPQAQGRQFFRNAGSATHRGLEGALTLASLERLLLRGSYTYTDAVYDEYTVGGRDLSGNRVPGVSPHRADVVLSYGLGTGIFGAVEGRYASSMPVDDRNTAFSPAYKVVDARAGLERVRLGRLELDPFAGVTNLLGATYNTSVIVNAFGDRYFEPGPGRGFYIGSAARITGRGD